MLVAPDERVPIARLLQFLEHGERLAYDCARAQADLAPDEGMRRFLRGQARQESYHAVVFRGAIGWLAPRHLGVCPQLPAMERYRILIEDAIRRKDLLETLMAEQIILEGLGEAILARIEEGLVLRKAPFARLRRILLHQEEAHHQFGRRMLARAMAAGTTSAEALRPRAEDYLALADEMVLTLTDLFESIDEDPTVWASDVQHYLPDWLASCCPDTPLAPINPIILRTLGL
jgi:hypothetical protein